MSEDEPDTSQVEDELEVTDLGPRRVSAGDAARLPGLPTRAWQRLALGLVLVLLVAVLLGGPLSWAGLLRELASALASPTPTEVTGSTLELVPTSTPVPPTPAPPQPSPTAPSGIGVSGVPTLGAAPASCSGKPPVLTDDGNPTFGEAIGTPPVLLGGFIGPYAALPIGPAVASASSYPSWLASYTPYGWAAPIDLILHTGVSGPVTLSGLDPHTGYPLWFGFVSAGVEGAPQHVVSTFNLDPADPPVPAGGEADTEEFWYGYAFLPGAGCYTLDASWPGGSWRIEISAGAVSTGH